MTWFVVGKMTLREHDSIRPSEVHFIMFIVNRFLSIPDDELSFSYSRSAGPGGQNVNKVNSKATLRWNVSESAALPDPVRQRFCEQQTHRINQQGVLVISSQRHREQLRNARDCLEKLRGMVEEALRVPKKRRPTRIPQGAKRRRLDDKRRKSATKRLRQPPNNND
jgi:ribosome-associated protein